MPPGLLAGLAALLLTQQMLGTAHTGRTVRLTYEPDERIWIPSGEFVMGSTQRDLDHALELCRRLSPRLCGRTNFRSESPPHRVRTRAYAIGRFEVSNAEWERCLRAGACQPRAGHRPEPRLDAPNLPVVDVTYADAQSYCRWRGGRLPTEAEWERAARGPTSRRFPWGELWNGALCNHGRGTLPNHDESDGFRYLAPVDAFPAARSPYGAFNMVGNAWEWVADWYADDTYQQHGREVADPLGPDSGLMRIIRGGSWASPGFATRGATRGRADALDRSVDIGFRCAWDS